MLFVEGDENIILAAVGAAAYAGSSVISKVKTGSMTAFSNKKVLRTMVASLIGGAVGWYVGEPGTFDYTSLAAAVGFAAINDNIAKIMGIGIEPE